MLAAIDVGSNTTRLLLGDVVDGQVRPLRYERVITRLKGGQNEKGLAPDAMERTLSALQTFGAILRRNHPEAFRVVGTEALRSAANQVEFRHRLHDETGMDLHVLSGEEEAVYSANGALSAIEPTPEKSVIVDIGGGSTEIILTSGKSTLHRQSCPLGVVRLAEMAEEGVAGFIEGHITLLREAFSAAGLLEVAQHPETAMIGTAGTVTTIAAIDLDMEEYDWRRVNNHCLTRDRIGEIHDVLKPLTAARREEIAGMEKGRGDLIVPGLSILMQLLGLFRKQRLLVSDFGLLEGVLLSLTEHAAMR